MLKLKITWPLLIALLNDQGEWAQSDPDDVNPLENGFRAEYARLDPETFEVSRLFWFRAE